MFPHAAGLKLAHNSANGIGYAAALVGAVTGGGIKGNLLGTIEICDKYSLIEIPEQLLDEVVRAMQNTLIKGKRVVVRRFVEKTAGKSQVRA